VLLALRGRSRLEPEVDVKEPLRRSSPALALISPLLCREGLLLYTHALQPRSTSRYMPDHAARRRWVGVCLGPRQRPTRLEDADLMCRPSAHCCGGVLELCGYT
jgi:hypothetical protein